MNELDIQKLIEEQRAFDDRAGANKAILQGLQAVANTPNKAGLILNQPNTQPKFTFGDDYKPEASPLDQAMKGVALKKTLADIKSSGQKNDALDPNSAISRSIRNLYKLKGYTDIPDTASAAQVQDYYGKEEDRKAKAKAASEKRAPLTIEEQLALAKRKAEIAAEVRAEADRKKREGKTNMSNEERLQGLNTTQQARFDNIMEAAKAATNMRNIVAAGGSRYSLVGDNPFTLAFKEATDAIGRMQSGGQLNEKELKLYQDLLRSPLDSPKMRIYKLQEFIDRMGSRAKTMGFDTSVMPEFGGTPKEKQETGPAPFGAEPSQSAPIRQEVREPSLAEAMALKAKREKAKALQGKK